jgi:hypothetical protein
MENNLLDLVGEVGEQVKIVMAQEEETALFY